MEKFFYLGQIFDAIHSIGVLIFTLSCIFAVGFGIYFICAKIEGYENDDDEVMALRKVTIYSIIVVIISSLVMQFVPSKETWYLMNGGRVIEEVASNEKVKDTASKTLDIINEYLDKKLNKN